MSEKPTLRPCPFCGGAPFHIDALAVVRCGECGINMGGKDYVEKWNRRAPLTAHDFYLRYVTIDGVPVPPLSDHALMLFDVYDKIEKVGGELRLCPMRRGKTEFRVHFKGDLMKLPDFLKMKE